MRFDAIVVGGSFAGLAAAMQLARARRQVAVVDAGQPRNRFSPALHGMPGQDGRSPAAILGEARAQLAAYPAASLIGGEVATAAATSDGFLVQLADGREMTAARLILAHGLADAMPGAGTGRKLAAALADRWGHGVLHCPYCHGYETAGGPLGVLATRPEMAAHALLFTDWGPTTLLLNGIPAPDAETAARLTAAGVTIETVPVAELLGPAPGLTGIRLADGRELPMTGLFVAPETRFTAPLAQALGCRIETGPTGPWIATDDWGLTSVPGVYAAGDIAFPMHNASLALASGVRAGVGVHRSLVFGG
jgi:thioredoxin reductase